MSRPPVHPGEILSDEIEEMGISAAELARQLKISPSRVARITRGEASITADTALRLAKWFGTSPEFWLNLQKSYELRLAQQKISRELKSVVAYRSNAHQFAGKEMR